MGLDGAFGGCRARLCAVLLSDCITLTIYLAVRFAIQILVLLTWQDKLQTSSGGSELQVCISTRYTSGSSNLMEKRLDVFQRQHQGWEVVGAFYSHHENANYFTILIFFILIF